MPIYTFRCKKCNEAYEELVSYDATGKYKSVKCPACNSKSKEKLVDCASFAFTNPVGTDRWNSEAQGHDYRYRYKAPAVAKEREMAQKLSHVGPNPYREIDDISSGKYFGEVK